MQSGDASWAFLFHPIFDRFKLDLDRHLMGWRRELVSFLHRGSRLVWHVIGLENGVDLWSLTIEARIDPREQIPVVAPDAHGDIKCHGPTRVCGRRYSLDSKRNC